MIDRIRGPQMHPVFAGTVEELQQHIGIAGDLGDGLGILGAVGFVERCDRHSGFVDVLGVVILFIAASAFGCADFDSAARTLAG